MSDNVNLRAAQSGDNLCRLISDKLREENGNKEVKLSGSVWTQILDVVDEEQNSSGQVYNGGKERKNWGHNYVIYVGKVVSFTKDVWNKIKALAGIKTDNAVSEKPPVSSGSDEASSLTSQVTTVPPKSVEPPKTTGIPEDLTPYDMELINTRREDLAETTTKDAFGRKIAYDKNGYLCTIEDDRDNTKLIINRNEDNSLKDMSQVTRDSNGNETKDVHWNSDGGLEFYREKEYSGKDLTREIQRGKNGEIQQWQEYEGDRYNPSKKIYRNPDGELNYYEEFQYDNPDDMFSDYKTVRRDAQGNIQDSSSEELVWVLADSESSLPNGVNRVDTPWRNEVQQRQFRENLESAKNIILNNAESLGLTSQEIEIIKGAGIESVDVGISRADKQTRKLFFNVNTEMIKEPNVGFFVELLLHETNHVSQFGTTDGSSKTEERACETRAINLAYQLQQQGLIEDYTIPVGSGFKLSSLSSDEQIEEYISTWLGQYYKDMPD